MAQLFQNVLNVENRDINVTSNTLDQAPESQYNSEQKKERMFELREERDTIDEAQHYAERSGFRKSKQLNILWMDIQHSKRSAQRLGQRCLTENWKQEKACEVIVLQIDDTFESFAKDYVLIFE